MNAKTMEPYGPATTSKVAAGAIISILTGAVTTLLYAKSVVQRNEDALDGAIIAERRGEPSEPLGSVLDELGLNE